MTRSSSDPGQEAAPGKGSPDASATPAATPGSRDINLEEPVMALEPDLPSDGRDLMGEAMIRDLPQRPELSEPPSQPDPSSYLT